MQKLSKNNQIIIAFIPVLHRGYMELFKAYPAVKKIYLIDPNSISDDSVEYLRKDLRKLDVNDAVQLLNNMHRFDSVKVFEDKDAVNLDISSNTIILPDEDISHVIAKQFKKAKIVFYGVFLRWDRRSLEDINKDAENVNSNSDPESIKHMISAVEAAGHSTDIWRRVGGLIVIDGNVWEKSSNMGEPAPYTPWIEGDPRNIFNRGVGIEMSIFSHAEATLIARAAKEGISLKGATLYATDFPCPACAKLVAHSGIKNLYYKDGYAVLDGDRVLEEYGVERTKVTLSNKEDKHPEIWIPYVKKSS